ncbi:MAG: DUF5683 domain-containing protein [Bacteroidota bacterium]
MHRLMLLGIFCLVGNLTILSAQSRVVGSSLDSINHSTEGKISISNDGFDLVGRNAFSTRARTGWQPDSSSASTPQSDFPDPNTVLYRSLMLPGWGQVTNGQFWKVPLIYGLFAGVTLYNLDLTRKYKGFRAAYYNETRGEESDFRFGPTPDFVPNGITEEQMRRTRDQLHNQRDMSYLFFVLAYGLNALDAYVYAHMRSFDVSDDLSARATLSPVVSPEGAALVKFRVGLFSR